jgi:oxaloacetate decarboxylase gamma subunit
MTDLFRDGLWLTVLGMGTVFGFLLLLIGAVTLLSAVLKRVEDAAAEPAPAARRAPQAQPEIAVVAAIAHAAHQHR